MPQRPVRVPRLRRRGDVEVHRELGERPARAEHRLPALGRELEVADDERAEPVDRSGLTRRPARAGSATPRSSDARAPPRPGCPCSRTVGRTRGARASVRSTTSWTVNSRLLRSATRSRAASISSVVRSSARARALWIDRSTATSRRLWTVSSLALTTPARGHAAENPKSRAALSNTTARASSSLTSARRPVEDLVRVGIGALRVRVVVAPQEAVGAGERDVVQRDRVVLERRVHLAPDVVARQLGEDRLGPAVPLVREVVLVERRHRPREPSGVDLDDDDVQVGEALEHAAATQQRGRARRHRLRREQVRGR